MPKWLIKYVQRIHAELVQQNANGVSQNTQDEWRPVFSQTRIERREPTSSYTRVIHHRSSKWRYFSTLGHKQIWECPECRQLLWDDYEAIYGHVNWHEWLDDQLGIPSDEKIPRQMNLP